MFKTDDSKRYISIAAILVIIVPTFAIVRYGQAPGFYIGTALYTLVGMFAIYEVLTAFGFNKYLSIFSSMSLIAFILVDYTWFDRFVSNKGNIEEDGFWINILLSWKSYLIITIASLIPMATENKAFKTEANFFLKQLMITFVFVITATFIKTFLIINGVSIIPLIFFLLIATFADTFGYFGGKLFGKKLFRGAKLAPKLSPKKTWAGAVIGFVASFAFALLYGYYMDVWIEIDFNQWGMSVIMAIVLSIFSPVGDLLFSGIKRKVGIKDFSDLLPGHGGIFDRIDAISVVTSVGALAFIIFI